MLDQLNNFKDEISRRQIMQGIAGMTLGVSTATVPLKANSQNSDKKKVVRIYLSGGMSHLDSFDPKPKKSDLMGKTKTIRTNTGERISEYFPNTAKLMDRIALIRGMNSSEGDHERAMYLTQTSYTQIGTIKHPFFGAWMQQLKGKINPDLPSSVSISNNPGAGFLGSTHDPFVVTNPLNSLRGLVMKEPTSEKNKKLLKLMADVRLDFHKKYRFETTDAYKNYYNDSIRLMQSEDLSAFNISLEDSATRKKYDSQFGNRLLLARRLIEAGVQYVDVRIGGWDHHNNLWDNDMFPQKGRELDKGLSTFLKDMESRGLLKNTTVTLNTEFGRTPKISRDKGRDHHRGAYSCLLFGAGVKGGVVYGKTDDQGNKVIENSVRPNDFNATLAKILDMRLDREIYSPDNRPFTVAREGKPVEAVIA